MFNHGGGLHLNIQKEFGLRIQQLRKATGMSQEKFALLCSHPGEFVPGTAFYPKPPLIFVRRSPPTNCYSS